MDGSCKGNRGPCGGGGIIRDNYGKVIVAFLEKLRVRTNNRAKLQALLNGILVCKELGYYKVIIETNSAIVVGWLEKKSPLPMVLMGILGELHRNFKRSTIRSGIFAKKQTGQ